MALTYAGYFKQGLFFLRSDQGPGTNDSFWMVPKTALNVAISVVDSNAWELDSEAAT